jgi:hypothetical protein
LNATRNNLAGHHTLMNDLDSNTDGYEELASPTANGGKGWQPIGAWGGGFTGSLDGRGYEIRSLFIARPDGENVGLFGVVDGTGVVRNVGVIDADVSGGDYRVAVLTGTNRGSILNCYSTGSVSGGQWVGGLVGLNDGWPNIGPVSGTVSESYSAASVSGNKSGIGGLVGGNDGGTLSRSYSTGDVIGYAWVGGVTGTNTGYMANCHSIGSVTGDHLVGGLVGESFKATVISSYSTGSVIGNSAGGGLVGSNTNGTVSYSFWDSETSGQATSAGGTGQNTTEMQDIATFSVAGWNITAVALNETNPAYICNIVNHVTYPFLSRQLAS